MKAGDKIRITSVESYQGERPAVGLVVGAEGEVVSVMPGGAIAYIKVDPKGPAWAFFPQELEVIEEANPEGNSDA